MNAPSLAMLRVVERLQREAEAHANDPRRREERFDVKLSATAVSCDEHGTPNGRPVEGAVVNLSTNGLALLLTRQIPSSHLAVTITSVSGDTFVVVLKVTRSQPVGPYISVGGPLVRRIADA